MISDKHSKKNFTHIINVILLFLYKTDQLHNIWKKGWKKSAMIFIFLVAFSAIISTKISLVFFILQHTFLFKLDHDKIKDCPRPVFVKKSQSMKGWNLQNEKFAALIYVRVTSRTTLHSHLLEVKIKSKQNKCIVGKMGKKNTNEKNDLLFN